MTAPPQEDRRLGPAPAPASGASEAAPSAADPGSGLFELARVVAALAVVLGLIFVTRVLLRRMGVGGALAGGGRPSGVLAVLARYPVARGQSLVLLKSGSRVLLLHQTRSAITPLSEIVEPDEVAELIGRIEGVEREASPGRFGATLARYGEVKPAGDSVRYADGEGNEIVDLTRRGSRAGSWLTGRPGRRAAP